MLLLWAELKRQIFLSSMRMTCVTDDDRHRTVDDAPFGGGQGMLMKPAPIFEAVS